LVGNLLSGGFAVSGGLLSSDLFSSSHANYYYDFISIFI
jgi:hypothetical protein